MLFLVVLLFIIALFRILYNDIKRYNSPQYDATIELNLIKFVQSSYSVSLWLDRCGSRGIRLANCMQFTGNFYKLLQTFIIIIIIIKADTIPILNDTFASVHMSRSLLCMSMKSSKTLTFFC